MDDIWYCRDCGKRWVGYEEECDSCGSEHTDVFTEDDIEMEKYEMDREDV